MYAIGLAATFVVIEREARRRGLDTGLLVNGMIIVAVAALIGGRLYHVIDQWDRYKDDLLAIVLPPYSGLGVYGGIVTGFAAGILYARWKRQPVLTWADVVAPGLLVMQAVARWGNFFNQELYGPPTDLPWGIPIECANRTADVGLPAARHDARRRPLPSALPLRVDLRARSARSCCCCWPAGSARLRPGDITLLFFVWYGTTRFLLEPLRSNNWTVDGVAGRLDHQRGLRARGARDPGLAPPARSPRRGRGAAPDTAQPESPRAPTAPPAGRPPE